MSKLSPPHDWIERDLRPRFPQLAEKATDAWDIAMRAAGGGELQPGELFRLEQYCNDRSSMLRDWSGNVVASLSEEFRSAADLLLKLVGSKRSDVALSAVAALHYLEQPELRETVARVGLAHRSKKVRELAACKAHTFRIHGMRDALAVAVSAEKDEACRKSLDFSLHLLRDGHHIEARESGGAYITVSVRRGISGQEFSREELEAHGVERLIEQLRSGAKY